MNRSVFAGPVELRSLTFLGEFDSDRVRGEVRKGKVE